MAEFRATVTSSPEEYDGVVKPPWNIDPNATEDCFPDGFASFEVYVGYCNVLGEVVTARAVDAHPSWKHADKEGAYVRVGKTGPSTPETLRQWFETNHPERAEIIADALRHAVHQKHGLVAPKLS